MAKGDTGPLDPLTGKPWLPPKAHSNREAIAYAKPNGKGGWKWVPIKKKEK